METRIAQALTNLFERHRIVFWYDTEKNLRGDFEALSLSGVQKLELTNGEFGLKYRLLREEPEQKFLLYREGPPPIDLENWLLDVQLAHEEFRTDQVALWLSDLELAPEFADVVQDHVEFFEAVKRKEALKPLLKADDSSQSIRMKMLAVCVGGEPRIDSLLETLLQELAERRDEKFKLVERCKLDSFLWAQLERTYGYVSTAPSIHDFSIELFKSCYHMATNDDVRLTSDALVFLKRWMDSRQFGAGFETLSSEYAEVLAIEQHLVKQDLGVLAELDYFRIIDQKIISELARAVAERTMSSVDVTNWVRKRRQKHWYEEFKNLYEAIDFAVEDCGGVARLEVGTMILDHLIWVQNVAADLVAPAHVDTLAL